MCLFPLPNNNIKGQAYKKGVTNFACGGCPECMTARANKIMLRDVFEASSHKYNCMCTLTYDTYIRDERGRIIGERVSDKKVNVRDCQLFIKRLRIYVQRHFGVDFKYRLSAEYGKKTHRPHYHVIFFGWTFPDVVEYKRSKRGNLIYTSHLLSKMWRHGICTVDSIHVNAAIAKYCSKYTSKDHGAEDTFSLCSHGIGIDQLCQKFNGLYYVVEGQRYSIPREVWQRYITDCYSGGKYHFSTKYINKTEQTLSDGSYDFAWRQRRKYQIIRDHDPLYMAYLDYWSRRAETWKVLQPSVFDRIRALPEDKYHFYKVKALETLAFRNKFIPDIAPRSNCITALYNYFTKTLRVELGIKVDVSHLPIFSRLNRANDTFSEEKRDLMINPFDTPILFDEKRKIFRKNC